MITIAGASRISSVRGLNASPQTAIVLPFQAAEIRQHLGDQPLFLRVVRCLDRVQNLEVVSVIAGRLDQRLDVLGKTAAAIADAGKEERRSDPAVGADGPAHLIDVGANQLAHVRHLVHERDARGENRVRGVLAELRARGVHHHDRRAGPRERPVELLHQGARPVVVRVDADDHAVGLHEVLDRGALLQELGVADHAERLRRFFRDRRRERASPCRQAPCSCPRRRCTCSSRGRSRRRRPGHA